jgi:SAM-dependent methyltransferase
LNRETTNRIRYLMEEWLPPALRDTSAFRWAMERVWGKHINHLADFRKRAPFLTEEEYERLYREHPRVHAGTDNSEACIRRIANSVVGDSVCDVGCGTGFLLKRIKEKSEAKRFVGVDFVFPADHVQPADIEFVEARIERLPFQDNEFDTVVCTHVVEHILDYRTAIAELRRITKRRLIIVVPQEREGRYTFNPHFNFWPYPESFLRSIQPIPEHHECATIGRDIYYQEDKTWKPKLASLS